MKHTSLSIRRSFRIAVLIPISILALLLLSACASHGPNPHYSAHGYYSVSSGAYYHRPYTYYGSYQPGWFVAGPYFPGNYWGLGAMVYWPTYSSSYYYSNHYYGGGYYQGRYYPYSDPWYYSYGGHYRNVYGHYYGPWNGPYYGPYYGMGYSYGRPHYGNSHSYRPPGRQDYQRPDPVVIPVNQRGPYGAAGGYSDEIDERQRRRESRQPDRRSATVVTERQGMANTISIAPGGSTNSGMVVSSRNERKTQPSRLHPVAPVTPQVRVGASPGSANPGSMVAPTRPVNPVEVSPAPRSLDTGRRSFRAPASVAAPGASSRPEPAYQHRLDSNSIRSRDEFRPTGNGPSGRDQVRERERDPSQRRQ